MGTPLGTRQIRRTSSFSMKTEYQVLTAWGARTYNYSRTRTRKQYQFCSLTAVRCRVLIVVKKGFRMCPQ